MAEPIKREFAMLVKLKDLWPEDKAWQENVAQTGVGEHLTFAFIASEEEGEDMSKFERKFALDELDFADVEHGLCDFMGSADEAERFFPRDDDIDVIYVVKATGEFCVMCREDLYDF